jgi:transposase
MAEYCVAAPNGPVHIKRLAEALQDPDSGLPESIHDLFELLLRHIALLSEKIRLLEREIRERTRGDELAQRLMEIPGLAQFARSGVPAVRFIDVTK